MKAILKDLNSTIASRGAVIVARDGMLIAADVQEGIDLERLSALGAAVLDEIGDALERAGYDGFTQIEIATEQGKVILVEAGATY